MRPALVEDLGIIGFLSEEKYPRCRRAQPGVQITLDEPATHDGGYIFIRVR